jgi:DNA-binding transcriptional LysR family regulator
VSKASFGVIDTLGTSIGRTRQRGRQVDPDLDLRRLRYFVAVAERLHFGQAAASLHITQPALSRQIQQLEHDVGVELFARTSREVTLTPGGEQLLRDGRRLLATARGAMERARHATGRNQLTVGFMLGVNVDPVLRTFRERHPEIDLQLQRLRWWDQVDALLDGRVDVGFVRFPVPAQGLGLLPLYTEPVTVALPSGHPLAGRPSVRLADIADEPVLRYADAPAAWNAFWSMDPRPDGTLPRHGPAIRDMEEIVEYVRAGSGVAFLPAPIATAFPRPDIAYVPVTGVQAGQIVLAWEATRDSALIEAFTEAAQQAIRPEPL